MQFYAAPPEVILPLIDKAIETCETRSEFLQKYPKYYHYLQSNQLLIRLRAKPKAPSNRWTRPWSKENRKETLRKWKQIPKNKIAQSLRARLYSALKGKRKTLNTKELVGCSWDDLLRHIESKFKTGMTWENYGTWHIDHVKPCAKFDMTLLEDQRKCFHFTNLQPLWARENLSKSDHFTSN